MVDAPARFVVDTHTLWWYLTWPDRLSAAAAAAFRLAETGNATIVVPAIVIAEYYFLSVNQRQPIPPAELLAALAGTVGIDLSDLGRTQLEMLDLLSEIPEMHDRLIAAEAVTLDAPVITRDAVLIASAQIETIW